MSRMIGEYYKICRDNVFANTYLQAFNKSHGNPTDKELERLVWTALILNTTIYRDELTHEQTVLFHKALLSGDVIKLNAVLNKVVAELLKTKEQELPCLYTEQYYLYNKKDK